MKFNQKRIANKFKIIIIIMTIFLVQEIEAREGVWDARIAQDKIISRLKESGALKEQKKLAKKMQEKAAREKIQYEGFSKTENFDKGDTLKNEKLAEETFKKIKVDEKVYKKVVSNFENKVKEEEEWAKDAVKNIENKIYEYSQNQLETKIDEEAREDAEINKYLNSYSQILKDNKTDQSIPEGLYVAVSLSMPEQTLVNLFNWSQKLGGKLIMRGLKNNNFTETIAAIKGLSDKGIAVDINPKIFRAYEIKQVPVFVLIENGKSDLMKGNVSLKYAVEQFKEKGDLKKEAATWLEKLQ